MPTSDLIVIGAAHLIMVTHLLEVLLSVTTARNLWDCIDTDRIETREMVGFLSKSMSRREASLLHACRRQAGSTDDVAGGIDMGDDGLEESIDGDVVSLVAIDARLL